MESIVELKRQLQAFFNQLTAFGEKSELEFLQKIIDLLQMLNDKYKFDELLNSGVRYCLTLGYVRSLIFQHFWNLEKLSGCLRRTEELLLGHLRPEAPLFFAAESKAFQGRPQLFGRPSLERLRLAVFLAETFMQHTAFFPSWASTRRRWSAASAALSC